MWRLLSTTRGTAGTPGTVGHTLKGYVRGIAATAKVQGWRRGATHRMRYPAPLWQTDPTAVSMSKPPAQEATTACQLSSVAYLPKRKKYARYEELMQQVEETDFSTYHEISCKPITKHAEDDMELLSDIVTWGERFLDHWQQGVYACSKCGTCLYSSRDKYKGPCVWPSFRKAVSEEALCAVPVYPYNSYTVIVKEVYCNRCDLFIGHQFEDAREKGDSHPEAHWRH